MLAHTKPMNCRMSVRRPRVKETTIRPTDVERTFREDQIIVSKTNTKGIITYANRTFLEVALYTEQEVLGQPHNMIRHPDMPRCVFKLLWDTLVTGNEIFAYVKIWQKMDLTTGCLRT
jgi:PAS domain-containing protein